MHVLVTGGSGYIGSHTVIELLNEGHSVSVIDNFSNSSAESIKRVEKLCNKPVRLHPVDLCDKPKVQEIFSNNNFDCVIHFAGLKSVGESVSHPIEYYNNNIVSMLTLCEVMQEFSVKSLIFSSSATVYGTPEELPLREESRTGMGITNPYGQTKFMIEQILKDLVLANPDWKITILRYFNPVGAHESGIIGEDPAGVPNNLLPFVAQVAVGKLDKLKVYGNDYPTPDGTGIRDYIHVVDLAKGHVAALRHIKNGVEVYNLGTGLGASVLQVITAFERASGKKIPYEVVPRRTGDIASCYADCSRANTELEWHATKNLDDACRDAWRWQSNNPSGYGTN